MLKIKPTHSKRPETQVVFDNRAQCQSSTGRVQLGRLRFTFCCTGMYRSLLQKDQSRAASEALVARQVQNKQRASMMWAKPRERKSLKYVMDCFSFFIDVMVGKHHTNIFLVFKFFISASQTLSNAPKANTEVSKTAGPQTGWIQK